MQIYTMQKANVVRNYSVCTDVSMLPALVEQKTPIPDKLNLVV